MYKVFIPSINRAGITSTDKLFKNPIMVVPQRQVEDYKKHNKDVLGCPDEIKGITPTRNFILNYCKENGIKQHIQIDDDIKYFFKHEANKTIRDVPPETFWQLLEHMFLLTGEWGGRCFGLKLREDKKDYREYGPFPTLCVIGANIIGIIDNHLKFDENCTVKEDYDYSLQHIRAFGRVIRFNKYGVHAEHLFNEGGCSLYRTLDTEMKMLEYLQKKWGKRVVKFSNNKNIIKVMVPIKGI